MTGCRSTDARVPGRATRGVLLAAVLGLAGCSAAGAGGPAPVGPVPAPWSAASLPPAGVPRVYSTVWNRAENRDRCALLAPVAAEPATAQPREATFSGGWGVAYDLPDLRSAFGVAGTGADITSVTYADWPFTREWTDGSTAGYGPEGGTGPTQLAYLRIPGQACLYNVWSRIGVEHLERLLDSLRYVRTGG